MMEFSVEGLSFCLMEQADFRSELLHPLENKLLAPSVSPARLVQFGLGRAAFRQALKNLERATGFCSPSSELTTSPAPLSDEPILIDTFGAPVLPQGVTGSISHTRSFEGGQRRGVFSAVAVVGRSSRYQTVGIDVEDSERVLSPEILRKAAAPAEEAWVLADQPSSTRMLFLLSAKEALYKALFPLCHQYFGFLDAELVLPDQGYPPQIRLLKTLSPSAVQGTLFSIGSTRLGRLAIVWITVPQDSTL